MGDKMTEDEKQRECERLCGAAGKRGVHTMAPIMCPILKDKWLNPKSKAQA